MCNITKIYHATCSKDELLLHSEYSGEWADGPEPIESSHHHKRQFWSVKRSHEKQVEMNYRGGVYGLGFKIGMSNGRHRQMQRAATVGGIAAAVAGAGRAG
ncbi:hypothetical protein B0H14DRAFT_2574314 [Mycena olivaceomarginata]|nr:hypothetical protein B0H14DRAFT_2574314 [Mycena olivaceomarginata]